MAKDIKALIVDPEVIVDDLDKIIARLGTKFEKLQAQQNQVKKVEEFNALYALVQRYETVIKLVEMAQYLMRMK